MKFKKPFRIIVFIFISITTIKLLADMASSSESNVAMGPRIKMAQVNSFYKTEQKKRKLTSEEEKIFNLATAAADIFSVSDVEIHNLGVAPGTAQEKMVDAGSIIYEIQSQLRQKTNWDSSLSKGDLERVQQIAGDIKSNLGENSFASAWITYQNGEKTAAKEILGKLFDSLYTSTMAMKDLGLSNSNPIFESTTLSNVLTPLSTPAENKDRESKLKKMKIHVSNLPDLRVMT